MSGQPEVRKGFVFEDSRETQPQKILGVAKVNTYLVHYTDGAGKKCVRLAFKLPGSDASFLLQEKIQGANVATASTEWFKNAFDAKLKELGFDGPLDASVESV